MQLGDKITFVNHDGIPVEAEVTKIFTGKDETSGKPMIITDLKETIGGREHKLVPNINFIKGARKIGYYIEKPFVKPKVVSPAPTPQIPPVKMADNPQPKQTLPPVTPAPPTPPTPAQGKKIQVDVSDNAQSSDQ